MEVREILDDIIECIDEEFEGAENVTLIDVCLIIEKHIHIEGTYSLEAGAYYKDSVRIITYIYDERHEFTVNFYRDHSVEIY